MSNLREFLMLAKSYDGSQNVAGWYVSSKLDGVRAFWDGGITRGMYCYDVPWANTAKDDRLLLTPKATGLWTRYGKSIYAPSWFLDQLPDFCLDGELWGGHGKFQETISTVKRFIPNDDWKKVTYCVFDCPSYREVFQDGEIRNKGKYEKVFQGYDKWAIGRAKTKDPKFLTQGKPFDVTVKLLQEIISGTRNLQVLMQDQLPYKVTEARNVLMQLCEKEVKIGGEGLIVRMGRSMWVPKRIVQMLKVKPYLDDEGVVIGYTWGKESNLGSKLQGLMGSITIKWRNRIFELSGFTEQERIMFCRNGGYGAAFKEGLENPGKVVNNDIENPRFPRGSVITFRYRELTNDNIPKEARYLRKYEE